MCGNLWISEDGARIYTACGNSFRASDVQDEDMTYAGALPNISSIQHLDHSAETNLVAAIPGNGFSQSNRDTEVRFYDHEFLQNEDSVDLPSYEPNAQSFATHGRYVFFHSDGSAAYALAQVDASAGLLKDYVLITIPLP